MILVFSHKVTSRLKYTLNLIFRDLLRVPFELTTSRDEFAQYTGPKISYTKTPIDDEFFIQSKGILFENGINNPEITVINFKTTKAFFGLSSRSSFEFDIFAASFFMASRYEEYLPHKRDLYDRFDAEQSLAYKEGFLTQPVVNIWAIEFAKALKLKHSELEFPKRNYSFTVTVDVDSAYAYQEKGLIRSVAGYAKNALTFKLSEVALRTKVLLGSVKDPYDTFDYQLDLIKKHKLNFIYFFLLGDYGVNDKNIPVTSKKFQSLVKSLADYGKVGIHPSFGSNNNFEQLSKEVNRLAGIVNREIHRSRQHFLKLRLPDTYRDLIELDIQEDYTMGYASNYGFRAGMCTPFYFYDLDLEVETVLKVRPFMIMEGTLKYYMKIGPDKAMGHYERLIDEVKAVNGDFISLWHNDSIGKTPLWEGWREVFEAMIQYGKE